MDRAVFIGSPVNIVKLAGCRRFHQKARSNFLGAAGADSEFVWGLGFEPQSGTWHFLEGVSVRFRRERAVPRRLKVCFLFEAALGPESPAGGCLHEELPISRARLDRIAACWDHRGLPCLWSERL